MLHLDIKELNEKVRGQIFHTSNYTNFIVKHLLIC